MDLSHLHFSHPSWFLALLAIPLIWALFFLYFQKQQPRHQLEKFIDKHLIPYLLVQGGQKKERPWTRLFFWSFVWCCLVFALAGPRWNYREIDTFSRDQSLAVLIDLSESMNVDDVAPSRLGRARQQVEDLLQMAKGVKIGLIAFAADPHMIVPMTEDKETIRHLLPSLTTDLVYVQGSKLTPALQMAAAMLENEAGSNKAIVVLSDGGFDDASAIQTAKELSGKGIVLYTIGVGTSAGAPLKDRQGAIVKKNGSPIISKLEKEKFREISKIGNGRYFDADHSGQTSLIFEDLEKKSELQQKALRKERLWDEGFYLFLLPVLPLYLFWYRRGYLFSLILFVFLPAQSQAALDTYFSNKEQKAMEAYDSGDYAAAAQSFEDPYRKGVSYYRQGDFKAAEEMFRQSKRPEVASSAAYNLGNSLAKQSKLQDAVAAYEDVLIKWPDHKNAKENLELVKKMLEEEQKNSDQKRDQNEDSSDQQQNEQQQESSDAQDQKEPSEGESKEDSSSSEQENSPSQESSENKEPSRQEERGQEPMPQPKPGKESPEPRSQADMDADLWLNQIKNDPKSFLQKKFYLESKKNGTKEEVDPW